MTSDMPALDLELSLDGLFEASPRELFSVWPFAPDLNLKPFLICSFKMRGGGRGQQDFVIFYMLI